jgi:putative spermidine/putrescine transport system permease protein
MNTRSAHHGFYRHRVLRLITWLALLAVILPLAVLLIWCFLNRWPELIPTAWTLRGVEALLRGTYDIWGTAAFSVAFSLVIACISTLAAALAAYAITRFGAFGRRLISIVTLLPIIVPVTVFGMGLHILFIRMHLNNTLFAVALAHLLCALPFALKIMVDVMQAGGSRLEQQASVLGASPLAAFVYGTIPVISSGLVSSLAISFIMSSSQYYLTMLMGGGSVETLATLLMPLIVGSERVISANFSVVFIAVNAVIFLLLQLLANRLHRRYGAQLTLR